MSAPPALNLPLRPGRRGAWQRGDGLVLGAGAALLAAVWLTLAGLALHEREQLLDGLRERNALMARIFADRATRNIESAALALSTLSDLAARGVAPEGVEMATALTQTLVSLPFLRSVAMLDAQGQILGSSEAGEPGRVVDLARLGRLPAPGRDDLGRYVPVRQLGDLALGQAAGRPQNPGVGFLPLIRQVRGVGGRTWYAVATLNLDAFANFQQVTLNDSRAASALLSYGGQLVAATGAVPGAIGDDLSVLPPFKDFLPQREQGAWDGAGLRPGAQIAAFRTSATRPLLALVEVDRAQVMAQWRRDSRRLVLPAAAALVLIGALTALALRTLRAREHSRGLLDAAQASVARSERELRVTLASLQELIFRTDATGALTFVNERWVDITGMGVEEALGLRLWDLAAPADRAATEALFSPQDSAPAQPGAESEGQARLAQVALQAAGREPRWFDLAVMPLHQGRQLLGFAGSAVDVTEARQAAQATREARDLAEEASRAKSEFVANISHELRTPLQSIIGFSELGLTRGRGEGPLGAMFTEIHRGGQRMLKLVNDLLDVAKIESNVGTLNLERSDLRGLLRGVAHELTPQLAARQLRIEMTLPEQGLRAKVDPQRFEQVLRNVLANAIKFAAPGSAIEVMGEHTDSGQVHLAFSDRGPGIPTAELDSIFEAFVQSSHTKDGSGGTGLGLAICRKIVQAHDGRIHAENRPGGGSVFHIHLPARVPAPTQPASL